MPYEMEGYTYALSTSNVRPLICSRCGASVVEQGSAIIQHNRFHEELDELVDWAKAVSKLFVKEVPVAKSTEF